MIRIAPSILAGDFLAVGSEIERLEKAGVDFIHFDVMDGQFVPNITFGFKFIRSVREKTKIPFDVHLMIRSPERYIGEFVRAGADILTFHAETTFFPIRLASQIREAGCRPGISINPGTPLEAIKDILPYVDLVLLMSVEPGFHGQDFINTSYERLQRLRKMESAGKNRVLLEIDGGISVANSRKAVEAGADILVIGADFFKQKDYRAYVQELKNG